MDDKVELYLNEEILFFLNINKWGMSLNRGLYIYRIMLIGIDRRDEL